MSFMVATVLGDNVCQLSCTTGEARRAAAWLSNCQLEAPVRSKVSPWINHAVRQALILKLGKLTSGEQYAVSVRYS